MSNRTPIELSDGRTHLPVQAKLVEGISIDDAIEADRSWRKVMNDLLDTASELGVPYDLHPEHTHWNWKVKMLTADARSEFYGVEHGDKWQGLMAITCGKRGKLVGESSRRLVYVDYIATAPWNEARFLSALGTQARFRGCGTALMIAAVKRSFELRYNGRIALHALAGAESFYSEKCNMTNLGLDKGYDDLRYFETTTVQAREFARRYMR